MDKVYNEIKEFLKDPIKNREAFFNNSSSLGLTGESMMKI